MHHQNPTGLPVVNPAMTLHAEQVRLRTRAPCHANRPPTAALTHLPSPAQNGLQSIRILAPLPTDGATLTTRSKILVRV